MNRGPRGISPISCSVFVWKCQKFLWVAPSLCWHPLLTLASSHNVCSGTMKQGSDCSLPSKAPAARCTALKFQQNDLPGDGGVTCGQNDKSSHSVQKDLQPESLSPQAHVCKASFHGGFAEDICQLGTEGIHRADWCCALRSQLALERRGGPRREWPQLLSWIHCQTTPPEEAWPGRAGRPWAAARPSRPCGSSGGGRGLGVRGRRGRTAYTQRASPRCGCAGG